jgi:hypothetical protein
MLPSQIMLKSGVAQGAVNQKMTQEQISQKDRNLVLGIQDVVTEQPSTPAPLTSTQPTGPKFVGLHWDPIHAKDHQVIQNSIWGEIHTSTSSSEETTDHQLAHEEYSTLSTLFAKKDKSENTLSQSSCGGNSTGQDAFEGEGGDDESKGLRRPSLRRKSSMPTTIDMSRSTNISIGLSSFKQKKMSIEMVSLALPLCLWVSLSLPLDRSFIV